MKFFCASSLLLGLLSLPYALSLAKTDITSPRGVDIKRKQAIKDAFLLNWKAYAQYALPSDKLLPVQQVGVNDSTLAGFSGTIVESLGTFLVMDMGNTPEYQRLLNIVRNIDFSRTTQGISTPGEVSLFELTIRYIGGLLSAYQMNGEKKEERFLVDQAKILADGLIVGWDGSNKIPFNNVNLLTRKPQDTKKDANLAEAGTLTMEWGMLSKYTNDPKYAKLSQGSVEAIIDSKPYFPSLWATRIWPQNNTASAEYITVGGGCDSFIEYLLKFPVLVDQKDHRFAQTYGKMIQTMREKLVSKTGVMNLTFIADYNIQKKEVANIGSHLACFIGGNIAYAGRLYKEDSWTQLGLEITESCYQTYKATETGIGPYAIGWFDAKGNATGWGWVSNARREFYKKHGVFVNIGDWIQHPEVAESLFYAHRITGDPMWRDMAWEAFQAIKKYASTKTSYAGIKNVNDASSDVWDQTESYLFSELLKYFYLIFSDFEDYSLDEYVFTTEAHIFKRGSGALSSTSSKKSEVNELVKRGGDWGMVQQDAFLYKPLVHKNQSNSATGGSLAVSNIQITASLVEVSTTNQVKPAGIFKAQPGAGRDENVKALVSQLGMQSNVAFSMLSRLPLNGAKKDSPPM